MKQNPTKHKNHTAIRGTAEAITMFYVSEMHQQHSIAVDGHQELAVHPCKHSCKYSCSALMQYSTKDTFSNLSHKRPTFYKDFAFMLEVAAHEIDRST